MVQRCIQSVIIILVNALTTNCEPLRNVATIAPSNGTIVKHRITFCFNVPVAKVTYPVAVVRHQIHTNPAWKIFISFSSHIFDTKTQTNRPTARQTSCSVKCCDVLNGGGKSNYKLCAISGAAKSKTLIKYCENGRRDVGGDWPHKIHLYIYMFLCFCLRVW